MATNNLFLTLFVKIKVAFAYVVPKCFMIASLFKTQTYNAMHLLRGFCPLVIKKRSFCMIKLVVTGMGIKWIIQ